MTFNIAARQWFAPTAVDYLYAGGSYFINLEMEYRWNYNGLDAVLANVLVILSSNSYIQFFPLKAMHLRQNDRHVLGIMYWVI